MSSSTRTMLTRMQCTNQPPVQLPQACPAAITPIKRLPTAPSHADQRPCKSLGPSKRLSNRPQLVDHAHKTCSRHHRRSHSSFSFSTFLGCSVPFSLPYYGPFLSLTDFHAFSTVLLCTSSSHAQREDLHSDCYCPGFARRCCAGQNRPPCRRL